MTIVCPACEDRNIQRLSLAYQSGISDINAVSSSTGAGFGGGGIGIGVGSSTTHGTAQTALSQRAAPPSQASYLMILKRWFIALIVIPIVFLILHVPARFENVTIKAIHGIALFALVSAVSFDRNQWPILFQQWQQSYVCLRWGDIFERSGESSVA